MINKHQTWLALSCIQVSGALSLPVILVGFFLGQHFTIQQCITQIFFGNFILWILAMSYQVLINQHKVSTIDFAAYIFGERGKIICAIGMVSSLIGWSAIQLHLISSISASLVPINSVVMLSPAVNESYRIGLMLVITAASGVVFDLPTFYRFSRTPKDAEISLILLFMIALPLIEGFGVYLSQSALGANSAMQTIQQYDRFLLAFLIFSDVIGTCLNLYSASTIIHRAFELSFKKALILVCVGAIALARVNIQQNYSLVLELVNMSAEILGVIVLTYAVLNRLTMPIPTVTQQKMHQLFFYLTIGIIIYLKIYGISMFNDLFLDVGFLTSVSMLIYYFISRFIEERI